MQAAFLLFDAVLHLPITVPPLLIARHIRDGFPIHC